MKCENAQEVGPNKYLSGEVNLIFIPRHTAVCE